MITFLRDLSSLVSVATTKTPVPDAQPCSSNPLVDISASDLAPLVEIRREHQTHRARTGVRTHKSSNLNKNGKELSDRQKLARRMQSIVREDQEQGLSSGLNREMQWKENVQVVTPAASGNTANAEIVAKGRAGDVRDNLYDFSLADDISSRSSKGAMLSMAD